MKGDTRKRLESSKMAKMMRMCAAEIGWGDRALSLIESVCVMRFRFRSRGRFMLSSSATLRMEVCFCLNRLTFHILKFFKFIVILCLYLVYILYPYLSLKT